MRVYIISDLHLGTAVNKPMDVFGGNWVDGYWQRVCDDWRIKVTDEDVVLHGGDLSWGMTLNEAEPDLRELDALPGQKFLIKGNHDYWWSSLNKLSALGLKTIRFVQNNAFDLGEYVICGTRGWTVPEKNDVQSEEDKKIYAREIMRLEMSLQQATKLATNGQKIICMTHYPPFNAAFDDSPFTDLMAKYGVTLATYGHLHGNQSRYKALVTKNRIPYYLTSCDFLNNTLLQLF